MEECQNLKQNKKREEKISKGTDIKKKHKQAA